MNEYCKHLSPLDTPCMRPHGHVVGKHRDPWGVTWWSHETSGYLISEETVPWIETMIQDMIKRETAL